MMTSRALLWASLSATVCCAFPATARAAVTTDQCIAANAEAQASRRSGKFAARRWRTPTGG